MKMVQLDLLRDEYLHKNYNVLQCKYKERREIMNTTITFRTEKELKEKATELFDKMGMSLSTALNMFMTQAVRCGKFPCSLEADITNDLSSTYPENFFSLFGSGKDMGLDEEPDELPMDSEDICL